MPLRPVPELSALDLPGRTWTEVPAELRAADAVAAPCAAFGTRPEVAS